MKVLAIVALVCSALLFPMSWGAEAEAEDINELLHTPIPQTLTFCGETLPLGDEDVLERLDTELVVILGSPITTTLWFKRTARYFPMIEEKLRERHLPEDLKYVALIESDLRAESLSQAGASGPWQFMPATGAQYGLRNSPYRDDRRDWELATDAALTHLADLRAQMGSWSLALAAYNCGGCRVQEEMDHQREEDFFGLQLPRETERYYFRAVAAKLVLENPKVYGINLEGARLFTPQDVQTVRFEVTRSSLPVAALAKAAGVSYHHFVHLNPWIRDRRLPKGVYRFIVPTAAHATFAPTLAAWADRNPEPKRAVYQVKKGDTLRKISERYGIPLEKLRAWNEVRRDLIHPGQKLLLCPAN